MKKRLSALLCAAMLLSLCACGAVSEPAATAEPTAAVTAAPAEETVEREYIECSGGYAYTEFVPMDDGAEICLLIVKPEKEGQFPTVITQNCYQAATEEFNAEYIEKCVSDSSAFVEAGYTFVMMQTRGTGNSPYESFLPYIHDTDDELEVLDWIRGQDFYDGEIFCNGLSYMGFTSMASLYAAHDDIKAISMQCPVSTRYDAWYQNGFVKLGLMGFWQGRFHRPVGVNPAEAWEKVGGMELFNTFPYINWPVELYGEQEDYWTGILTHPEDGDWWRTEAAGSYIYDAIASIDVPVLLFENFYDIFYEDSMNFWNGFSDEQKAQSAFVVGQFGHTYTGYADWPLNIGDSLTPTYNADYVVNFFDSVREGTEPTKVELGKVTYYPVDGERWYSEDTTITNGTTENVLYLNGGSTLGTDGEAEGALTYVYDPTNPALFTASDENGGNGSNGYRGLGTDAEPNSRQDILSFVSAPVGEKTFIKGILTADVAVSSDCEDTSFIVRIDVVKNGVAYNLREDITSLSYQLGDYTPGEKVTLHFETGSVVCQLNPGDYIRVDISSSAEGMYSLHTNVKGNQWEIAEPKIANNTVYTGISSITYYTEDLAA